MPTRNFTTERVGSGFEGVLVTWTGLLNTDDGAPFELSSAGDRSVQFGGVFGVGGSIRLEGSNDGVNYIVLADPSSTDIIKTAAAIEQVLELTRFIRPRVTAGDGTTNLTCHALLKR